MIRNFPGFSQGVSGSTLAWEAWQQAWLFGTTFVYMRDAEGLSREDGHYRLRLSDGATLTARAVVITTGASYRRLDLPTLDNLQGRGVFYGAGVSEAPAMRGQNVFVAGGGNSAGQAAIHLARWADHVTVLVPASRWPTPCLTTSSARSAPRRTWTSPIASRWLTAPAPTISNHWC